MQPPVVVNVGPVASDAAPASVAPPPPRGTAQLKLHAVTPIALSSPGCYLDQHIRDNEGVLTYPADGDGKATAVFGPQRYEGTIQGGELELVAETELDWDDNCHWGTTATIRGSVNGGPLTWTYQDRVITGTMCSGICHASTTFETSK